MPATRRGKSVRVGVAVACVLLGLVCLGLWRVLSGAERLPYSVNATASPTVRLTEGETYSLAVPGGVRALRAKGVPVTASAGGEVLDPTCTWSIGNSDRQTVTVTPERVDTKAVNTFAHFAAPVTGRLHIACADWGTVFVPDSEGRAPDVSLWYLVLSVLLLSVGLPLTAAAVRSALDSREHRSSSDPGEDDEIAEFIEVLRSRGVHREIGSDDGGRPRPVSRWTRDQVLRPRCPSTNGPA